jgi:Flp pilus assembly protein TadD
MKFPDGVMQQAFSDSSGSLEFSGLAAQTYVLRATKHGYLDAELQVDVRRGEFAKSVGLSMQKTQVERNEPAQGSVAARNLPIPDAASREFQLGAKSLNTEKNPRQSIGHLQRAIELYPAYSDAYFLLGTAQMQLNDATAAETSLRKAIALDARRTGPYYPLSMLLFGQRRFKDEEELLLSAQKQDAADWRWPFELARCHAQQSRWDSALQFGLTATGIANAPSKVHLLLADIYANSDKPSEAVAELELFAQLDPQSTYMARVREVLPALRQRAAATPQQPR